MVEGVQQGPVLVGTFFSSSLLACIMVHGIKDGRYVPLEDLPAVGRGVELTTVAEMWDNVAMLAA